MIPENPLSFLILDNEKLFKQAQELRSKIRKLEELVDLAASFLSEEDCMHYSTAVTFKIKHEELLGKKKK